MVPCEGKEIARAVATLIRDPELRARMAAAGRRFSERELSWPETGRRLRQLYEELAPAGKRRGSETGPARVSVVVLAHNEEVNLPSCLASLDGLRSDLFVVDSGSTDRTVEIATVAGAHVVVHPFEHYAAQRNWAFRT